MAWDAPKHEQFVRELYDWLQAERQQTLTAYLLVSKFFANEVATSDAFTTALGVEKDDITAGVVLAEDHVKLIRNQEVAQADRETVISRFLAGRLT